MRVCCPAGVFVHAGQEALVFDVAISADGCMAATVSDDFTCRVWDLDEECCMHVLEGHSGWWVAAAVHNSDKQQGWQAVVVLDGSSASGAWLMQAFVCNQRDPSLAWLAMPPPW